MRYSKFLIERVEEIRSRGLPTHVGFIMDGNRRWAKQRGLSKYMGHKKGFENFQKIVEFNKYLKIPFISFYAFSTENWNRSKEEVDYLMDIARKLFKRNRKRYKEEGIRFVHLGTKERLPEDILEYIVKLEEDTKDGNLFTVAVAFNYGGWYEIVEGVRKILKENKSPEEITVESFRNYLYRPEIPDVDLVIRTSGEMRISNFLLWRIAYAELYFTPTYWPDFSPEELLDAIEWYQYRERRFGK